MKVPAAILAALILFMTGQVPVVSIKGGDAEEKTTARKSCSFSASTCNRERPAIPCNKNPEKCCDHNFCNPFGACCCYTAVERPLLSVASFFIQRKTATPTNDNALSSYIGDIWHPPEAPSSL